VKVEVKFALEQATKAQRGSRCIALLFLTLALDKGGWSTSRPGRFIPRERSIVQQAGWAPGPVWTGEENFKRQAS